MTGGKRVRRKDKGGEVARGAMKKNGRAQSWREARGAHVSRRPVGGGEAQTLKGVELNESFLSLAD